MKRNLVFVIQLCTLLGIWVFSVGISIWIIHLIRLANRLQDAPTGSLAISVVAIPIFLMGASVLTYVFVGLQRERER
jgi:hypothetical protein